MQLTTTIAALAGLAAFATADNMQICAKKNQGALTAIGQYCQKTDIVVPSQYAASNHYSPDGKTYIRITGTCSPAMWVPQEYCMQQFLAMCAKGGAHGGKKQSFGNEGCQKWEIAYHRHNV